MKIEEYYSDMLNVKHFRFKCAFCHVYLRFERYVVVIVEQFYGYYFHTTEHETFENLLFFLSQI